uniref:Glycoside hydrolase family 19 catalytic domain-containing protein n=1 Tax=Calcidiscus leptoporus TaxID=127549 RepID=A0A7S0NV18_9EUKA
MPSPSPPPPPPPSPNRPPTPRPPPTFSPPPMPAQTPAVVDAFLDAVKEVNYIFKQLKSTAPDGCKLNTCASSWEPSDLYFWNDMITSLESMCTTGVAGQTFYAGEAEAHGEIYGLANLANFLAQTYQESIQYGVCDENNWSNQATVDEVGGTEYTAAGACGQLGQSYQDYKCADIVIDGELISGADMECPVDYTMSKVAATSAKWYGAPAPLFCAPRSQIDNVPRWDYNGWCPNSGTSWNQNQLFAEPFGSMSRGEIYYGPADATANVPPEILAHTPDYIAYVKGAIDQGTGENQLMAGTGCLDVPNHRAGFWKSCNVAGLPAGACPNAAYGPTAGQRPRTDVEGCCWWGRGAIQTTGVCNFGKLNYFLGAKAAAKGKAALYPQVDFCRDPGAICRAEHPDLKWVAGFFYWLNDVQPYDVRGGNYRATLRAWVDNGADVDDHSLVDFASGVVNRGCHDAPAEGAGGADPCGNGEVHAQEKRRVNFKHVWRAFTAAGVTGAPAGRRQLLFG